MELSDKTYASVMVNGIDMLDAIHKCRRHMLKKLVPETGNDRLVPETCTCVGQSGTSFFWYQFLARNRTQLYFIAESVWHMKRTVQRDWPEGCFGARN